MLTSAERQRVLASFRYFSIICQLPVRVNVPSWDVRAGCDTKWKSWTYRGSYALFMTHTLYKATSLLYTFLFWRHVPLHQMMVHGDVVAAAVMLVYWYYSLFIKFADVNAGFARITLTGNVAGGVDSVPWTATDRGEGHRYLWDRSFQDVIAISLPYVAPVIVMMIGACMVYDPTMKMLLYAAVPTPYQNWLSFSICFAEEMRFLIICIGIAIPTFQRQVIGFDLINRNLLDMLVSIETNRPPLGAVSIQGHYRSLRALQLYITVLNIVNRNLIFTWKLLCIGISITSGFAAIAHFSDFPIFGVMYYIILLELCFAYTVVYEKAFKVPDLITKVRSTLMLHTQRVRDNDQRNGLYKQLRSIPAVSIRVGEFHMMERTSTPEFLDHLLRNIVSMLVTFK